MLKSLKELLEAKKNFAFETTGAGTNYIRHLKEAQAEGYEVHLMFLWFPSPELAIERVAKRVQQGGHHIPEGAIRRRYFAGLKNLIKHYLPLVDDLKIEDSNIWKEIQEVANAEQL